MATWAWGVCLVRHLVASPAGQPNIWSKTTSGRWHDYHQWGDYHHIETRKPLRHRLSWRHIKLHPRHTWHKLDPSHSWHISPRSQCDESCTKHVSDRSSRMYNSGITNGLSENITDSIWLKLDNILSRKFFFVILFLACVQLDFPSDYETGLSARYSFLDTSW